MSKPPFSPLELQAQLRSRVPLDKLQEKQIENYICQANQDTFKCDHEVRALYARIDQIRVAQAALSRSTFRHGSLLSPIRKLPLEILHRIFIFAAGVNVFGVKNKWDSTAFILASVCYSWREIALDYPTLWASLAVSIEERAIYPTGLCIERSKMYPLSLVLESEPYNWDDHHDDLLKLFLRQSGRWLKVDMSKVEMGTLDEIRDLPLLEEAYYSERSEGLLPRLKHAPRLRVLSFEDIPATDAFSFENLTRITVNVPGSSDDPAPVRTLCEALCSCPNLTECAYQSCRNIFGEDLAISGYESLDAPLCATSNIQTFEIDLYDRRGVFSEVSDVFASLTLPFIHTLSIRGDSPVVYGYHTALWGEWPSVVMRDFIVRSDCHLTSLRLVGLPLSDTEVISFLNLTPALEHLSISEVWANTDFPIGEHSVPFVNTVTKALIQRLTVPVLSQDVWSSQMYPLVPMLKCLRLRVHKHFDADSMFAQMVLSRWRVENFMEEFPTQRIRTVVLNVVGRDLHMEMYVGLRELDVEGLMVTIIGNNKVWV
ncbi:hypothetical protein VNI00_008135 [Paramarasmius palmivorus]|uniref:F-box domain-containing protein n=1 Tax=Paramarasmius palmivorus TaxID=297713 RepID=A0AAW0CYY6_9AGAR